MRMAAFWQFVQHGGMAICLALLSACAPQPPQPSPGHLRAEPQPAEAPSIPPLVNAVPIVPIPQMEMPRSSELYTVVVNKVAVADLLFALARDAKINVDIHPAITGVVTLNAVDQTLPQILDRIARQVDLRYQIHGDRLEVGPDLPYLHSYRVDYVNLQRENTNEAKVSTQIASLSLEVTDQQGGTQQTNTGGNNSETTLRGVANNMFWKNLTDGILAILHGGDSAGDGVAPAPTAQVAKDVKNTAASLIVNREVGLVTARASARQHAEIQKFLDEIMTSARRQVLIEATIVEISLSDQYQAGVDWHRISGSFSYSQNTPVNGQTVVGQIDPAPFYTFKYADPTSKIGDIAAALHLLEQFGNVRVLSSPKLMALNNQPALLRVVDNVPYFEIQAKPNVISASDNKNVNVTYTYASTVRTVPEGIIVALTPQISENDMVMLNIRPTVTRIIGHVEDPNPILKDAKVPNSIPKLQIREVETVLRLQNAEIAVIGGLMQDSSNQGKTGLPVLSELPVIGDAFSYRNDNHRKTELAIFLRPTVVRNPSLNADLREFQRFLPDATRAPSSPAFSTGFDLNPDLLYQNQPPVSAPLGEAY